MTTFEKVPDADAQARHADAARGIAGVALAVITADRAVTRDERIAFHARLTSLQTFRQLGDAGAKTVLDDVLGVEKEHGTKGLLKLAAHVPSEMRLATFALAADLAFADRELAGREVQVLDQVQQALGIERDEAAKVRDVAVLKWRL